MPKCVWKLYLLMWKNGIVLKRHPFTTGFQILLPLLVIYITNRLAPGAPPPPTTPRPQRPRGLQTTTSPASPQRLQAGDELAYRSNESQFDVQKMADVSSTNFADKHMRDVKVKRNDSVDYFGRGLQSLLRTIDRSFIDSARSHVEFLAVKKTKHRRSSLLGSMSSILVAVIFLSSLVLVFQDLVRKIVEEKETGATELLKLMGMSRGKIWFSWFVQTMLIFLIIMSGATIMLKILSVKHSDVALLWVFLMSAGVVITVYWFAITTLFTSAWVAVTLTGHLWAISCIAPLVAVLSDITRTVKMATCLLPNCAVIWGICEIFKYERNNAGITFKNFSKSANHNPEDITLKDVFIMLAVDFLVYVIITWYIDAIHPGPFGIPKPLYFPCTISYYCTWRKTMRRVRSNANMQSQNVEPAAQGLVAGIRIVNLHKTFRKKKAVDGVTIDIYQDQITVLLGHNGAGKTTTMSIMTGMISATSGTVLINGYNIRTDESKARESLSLCPQHDMLFNDLTVHQHLMFFGMLKGLTHSEAETAGMDLLDKMQIADKEAETGKTLSGGTKRKVSLGIALIGGSKVVILDEPTTGLDPEARREVWDILLGLRGECTILITTHFMEEADVLGDRIAIMDHGKVMCYGTSLYLKNKYGSGYKLKMLTVPGYNVDKITQFVLSRIEGARLRSQLGSELAFTLPLVSKSQFAALFKALESSKSELHIDCIGVSITSLEDVFLRVGRDTSGSPDSPVPRRQDGGSRPRVEGFGLAFQRTEALLIKKMLYTLRHWFATLVYALLGILPMVGVMYLSLYILKDLDFTPRSTSDPLPPETHNKSKALSTENISIPAWYKYPESVEPQVGVPQGAVLSPESQAGEDHSTNQTLDFNTSSTQRLTLDFSDELPIGAIKHLLVALLWALIVPMGLIFLTSGFIAFALEDRQSGAKNLQRMTGVGSLNYWLACFLWDFLIYVFVAVWLVVVLVAVDTNNYFGHAKEAGVFMLLLVTYGASQIPLAYLFSYFRSNLAKCLDTYVNVNFMLGFFPIFVLLLHLFSVIKDENVLKAFYFIPGCNMFFGLVFFANQTLAVNDCNVTDTCGDHLDKSYLDLDGGIGWNLVALGLDFLLIFTLLLILDSQMFSRMKFRMCPGELDLDEDVLDVDVREEIGRVYDAPENTYAVAVYELEKSYLHCTVRVCPECSTTHAVKGVTFGVKPGECFGLLGFNGAGKTTVFKMLTGEIVPRGGDAFVLEWSLQQDKSKYLSNIGYCPQDDAICEFLTGREMLRLYALLRGVHRQDIKMTVFRWLKLMGLEEYKNVRCGEYSGGNKRKLSTAMALIGDPPLVFLDEPTSGVDPVARRNLWTILGRVIQSGDRAIVLTTHSMEECEALASRLAVMVLGQFVCIGENQYLKKKFCQGFNVVIKLSEPPVDENQVETVKSALIKMFNAQCVLRDERRGMLHYILTDKDLTWDQLFTSMESLKDNQKEVQDYTVSETTLEQVFLSFAKK